jgi:hypothetical protein
VLFGRIKTGKRTGTVHSNNAPYLGMTFSNSIFTATNDAPSYAYVMQDDVHCVVLTVRETLEFAAMLRKREVDGTGATGGPGHDGHSWAGTCE